MPPVKHEAPHGHDSSIISLLSGWAQQGAQTIFATQRIFIDLAMRQNSNLVHAIREQLNDPLHSPAVILNEIAGESISNFVKAEQVLLDLGKEQNELWTSGVKSRVGECPRRQAMVELLRRSVDTFIHLQEEYLKLASHQSHMWLDSAKNGKVYEPERLIEFAQEGVDKFIRAQKQFLDVVAEQTSHAIAMKPMNGAKKKIKPAELPELAQKATESFVEAQKRLVDVAEHQINAGLKTTGKAMKMVQPFPFPPLNDLTREAVKSYVEAQKAVMDVMVKSTGGARAPKTEVRTKKAVKKTKAAAVAVA